MMNSFQQTKSNSIIAKEPSLNSKSLQDNNHVETSFLPDYGLQSLQLPLNNLETNLAFDAFSESFKTASLRK